MDTFFSIFGPMGALLLVFSPFILIFAGKLLFRWVEKRLDKAIMDDVLPEAFCVVDCETTGLKVTKSQMIELAAIKVRKGVPDRTFSAFIAFDGKLPREIVKLTGIKDAMLKGAKSEAEVIRAFVDFVGDDLIVAYNAEFDMKFIKAACRRAKLPFENASECVLELAKKAWPRRESYNLGGVAEALGIKASGAHRALADCKIALKVYKRALVKRG